MHISMKRTPATGVYGIICLLFTFLLATPVHAAAPRIWGTPPTSVKVNAWYNFRPTASDVDTPTRNLRFSIANKPSWAGFSVYSGTLYGSPPAAGTWSNIRITVTDGRSSTRLPAFSIRATRYGGSSGGSGSSDGGTGSSGGGSSGGSSSTSNRAPTISGTPPASVAVGTAYNFRPTASDADRDTLTYSITNRPSWASFNTGNGTLSGTPTAAQVGTYSNIVIRVSDGKTSASLPAFSIIVNAVANGSATVSWTPPTRNTDGSALTNLAGYRIYYGTSSNSLNRSVQVANAGLASYVVGNLSPATWYFSVRAYTAGGAESAPSNVASKTIR